MPPPNNPARAQHPSEFFLTHQRGESTSSRIQRITRPARNFDFTLRRSFSVWFQFTKVSTQTPALHHTAYLFPPQGKSPPQLPRITPSLYCKLQAGVPWARKWQCPQPTELHPAKAHSWECHPWPPPSLQITSPSHPTQGLEEASHLSLFGSQN